MARLVNLAAPGSGLILLRREWLGFVMAVLFALLAQIAILGWWVVPRDIPNGFATGGAVGAFAVWLLAQWLVRRRLLLLSSPALLRELSEMRTQAAEALRCGDHSEAHRILLVARSVDDEDVGLAVLWAELMTAMGRTKDARRGWRRVLALDAPADQRRAARDALT